MTPDNTEGSIPEDALGAGIRQIPYDIPGPGLTRRIMSEIEMKKPGGIRRLLTRMRSPMTLSLSPLVAGALVLVIFVAGGLVFRQLAGHLSPPPSITSPNGNGFPVVFHLKDPSAKTVSIMGSFNDWNPEGYEMTRDPATGSWTLQVRLAPGKHEYVFWVDNQKTASDPNADLIREDDFGNENSVLFVKGNHGHSI
jgi:hypothetical protein